MNKNIIPYLEDLEKRINPDEEKKLQKEWQDFSDGKSATAPFEPTPRLNRPSEISWPEININDALQDLDLMIISQLKMCHDHLSRGSNRPMQIRSNYGCGIMPTMLGCKEFIMPREMNTLPNSYPLEGGVPAIRSLVEGKLPDFKKGWGPKVLAAAEIFMEIRKKYPAIAAYIRVVHPDTQGPMDISELVWGSDIFYALIDEPDMVHKLLRFVTDFYISFIDHWYSLLPPVDEYHLYSNRMHRGGIAIRNDSLMNLSPEMHKEFALPYDQEILSRYRGGMIHFCGKGDHFIEQMSGMKDLYAIDLSQPHLNDMEWILRHTIDKGINLHTGKYDPAGNHQWKWISIR